MKALRWLIPLALVSVICLAAAPVATADDQAWRTPLRLSEPTEIPGTILPAGDYVIKVVDTQRVRSIVQFLSSDESQVLATVLAIPDYRIKPADNTQFVYFERAAGSPPALKSWVYPGNSYGVEFVYPKQEAISLSERSNEVVYATPQSAARPDFDEPVVVVTPEKNEIPLEKYRARTKQPPLAAGTPAPTTMPAEPIRHLPRTASDLPAIGLLAAVSLFGAAGLRIAARG